eukprot:102489_1
MITSLQVLFYIAVYIANVEASPDTTQTISCGETQYGQREVNEKVEYIFTSTSNYELVYLDACNSDHDIEMFIFNSSGGFVTYADESFDNVVRCDCNMLTGDITIPYPVSIGDQYTFGISGYGNATGNYSITLNCIETKATLPATQCYYRQCFKCSDEIMFCESNKCVFDCIGYRSCESAIINASTSNVVVNCVGYESCYKLDIYGNNANSLIIFAIDDSALAVSYIECPQNKYCNITVNGRYGISSAIIDGTRGSKVFLKAYGYKVMEGIRINCPPDYKPGPEYTNGAICDIYAQGQYAIDHGKFTANEGFKNIQIKCEGVEGGECYKGDTKLYCSEFMVGPYAPYCYLQLDTNTNDFICDDTEHICNNITLATLNCINQTNSTTAQCFDCYGVSKCDAIHMTCESMDCIFDCIGIGACQGASIDGGNSNVVVNCHRNDACNGLVIYANKSDSLIIFATDDEVLQQAYIICPEHKYCNITVDGYKGISSAIITGTVESKLFVKAYGWRVMKDIKMHCPPDGICDIYVKGPHAVQGGAFFADKGFNNIHIKCEGSEDIRCYEYAGTLLNPTTLQCGENFADEDRCTLELDINTNDLICNDTTHFCNHTPNPTTDPTLEPTTTSPTFEPTKYDPHKEPINVLYISNTGCDIGICDTNNFNTNIFCTSNTLNVSNIRECCNEFSINSTPSPSVNDNVCNENNTLSINKTGTVSQSIISSKTIDALCFVVDPTYLCYNPTIEKVEMEQLYWKSHQEYLNISYQTQTNFIHNSSCTERIAYLYGCDKFKECAVLKDPLNIIWTAGASYIFYFIVHQGYYPDDLKCSDSKYERRNIRMNVEISVNCSSTPSTCKTFGYAWECMKGELICDNRYDGHGKIQMDIGIYNFNNSISILNKQIKIQGSGINKTEFYHNTKK